MNIKAAIIIPVILSVFFIAPVFAQDSGKGSFIAQQQNAARISASQLLKLKAEASLSAHAKERIQASREKIASAEAALHKKLQGFTDKIKADLVAKINTNLNRINKTQTDQMLKFLGRMSSELDKLDNLVKENSPAIKDKAVMAQAIEDARVVAANAKVAVERQAEQDYTVKVTAESNIKNDVQNQREKLYTDIMATRRLVIDAKQTVQNSIRISRSMDLQSSTSAKVKEATVSGK